MKFLLVAPQSLEVQGVKGKSVHQLNLSVIAALAEPYFSEIRIVEEGFEDLNLDESADLVGITMMSCQAKRGYELADHFKKRGITTICGGSHASFMVDECLEHFDSVVVNEAEFVWPQIMSDFSAGKLKPVYHSHELIDLKNIPIPRKDLYNNRGTTLSAQVIQSSRGCPLGCSFCTVTLMYGKKLRTRPVEHIVEEINRYPSKVFFFVDDNIFFSRRHSYELFKALIPLKIKWGSQGSLEMITRDEELLRLAVRSGCISLFVGIESIEQRTLNEVKKGFNAVKRYSENIKKIHKAGINIIGAFIFGFEHDTPETFRAVYDFAIENRLAMISTGIMTPFPGTRIYDKIRGEGKIIDDNWDNYTGANLVWEHPQMGIKEMKMLDDEIRCRFYSIPSIIKRFWANRSHPLFYTALNFARWRNARKTYLKYGNKTLGDRVSV